MRTRTPEQQAIFDKIIKTIRDALRAKFGDAVTVPEHDDAQTNIGNSLKCVNVQPANYSYGPMPSVVCVSDGMNRTTNYPIERTTGEFNVEKMVARVEAGLKEIETHAAEQEARAKSREAAHLQVDLGRKEIETFNASKGINIDNLPVWFMEREKERDGKGLFRCEMKLYDLTLDEIHALVTLANSFKRKEQ